VVPVRDGDDIMLITTGGMVNRTHVNEIRIVGRNTQGVRIMDLKEGDRIASIAKVVKENGEVEAEPGDSPPAAETPEAEGPGVEENPPA
jgi:DNA gyrase subunit A